MTSIIYKTHTNGSLSQSNEIDVIESYLNRRRRTDYTEVDKLLDTILQESTCSNNVSFQSGISNSNLSIRRNFDDAAEKRSENDSDVSDQVVLFQNVTEVDQSASLQLKQMGNHLENFYLVKVVRSWINFRPGSFSEMVVKSLFYILRTVFWIITHPTTRTILCQIGMKIFELFVTIILAGIMILISFVTFGRDLETNKNAVVVCKSKDIVKVNPQEATRNYKSSSNRIINEMTFN